MWVIYSTTESRISGEELYWNNELGWGSRASATVFESTDYNLPLGGEWKPLQDNNF